MDFMNYVEQTCPTCGLIDYRMFFGCRRCIANEHKDVTLTIRYHDSCDVEHYVFDATMPIAECYATLKIKLKADYGIELSALDEITLDMGYI
jgi:hypothetical protein